MDKLRELRADCNKCRGFCCRALFFFKNDGFPYDKPSGVNCKNLMDDYSCKIHHLLSQQHYYGCTNYDCLGAGQKTALLEDQDHLFDIFTVMEQLHEMLWYLYVAIKVSDDTILIKQLEEYYQIIASLTHLKSQEILMLDLHHYRQLVEPLLQKVLQLVNNSITNEGVRPKKIIMNRADFMGMDFQGRNLAGQDFKGAFLIGANLSNCDLRGVNFLGSDVRNMDIRNSDLSNSLFLTPAQLNACIINRHTKLPKYLKDYKEI